MEKYQVANNVLYRKQGETGTLFNPATGKIYSADHVGSSIIDLLATPKALEEIERHVIDRFSGADPDQVHRDITAFLRELVSYGLVDEKG